MVPGSNTPAKADIEAVLYVLAVFGRSSGFRVNASKTYALVKQSVVGPSSWIAGFAVRESVCYLGVLLGHLTLVQAYGLVVAKMMLRAYFV